MGILQPIATAGPELLEVEPGAERGPGAGQHRDAEGSVAIEAPKRRGQLRCGRRVHRVARLRTVDRHREHGAIDLVANSH